MITFLRLKQILKRSKLIRWGLSLIRKQVPMRMVSYGEDYPDITFYIIGRDNPFAGGWSLVNTTMMHLAYALDQGYVPIVDMQNYRNQYTKPEELGRVNFWEKYFEQPENYSLDDIRTAKRVIINSSQLCPDPRYNTSDGSNIWEDQEKLSLFRKVFTKYVRFNDYAKNYFDLQTKRVLKDKQRVIGVLCRGTDFLVNKPTGHEIQPAPEVVLSDVLDVFKSGNYDAVFLATEDQDILDLFKKKLGENLLYIDQIRVSKRDMKGDKWLSAEIGEHTLDEQGDVFLDYFSATYILTKCKCLFAGRNNGSKGVLYMPSDFSFVKIYNLGQY